MARFFSTKTGLVFLLVILGVFVCLPRFTPQYMSIFLYQLFLYMVLAVSYDILGGYAGYMNLGHACFFGIGGYTFAILANRNFGLVLSMAGGMLTTACFAVLISYPFFRLRGAYFALANLGLIILLGLLAHNLKPLTGGADGLFIPISYELNSVYYAAFILCLLTIFLSYRVGKSRYGLALVSIRADEDVASTFGVNPYWYKVGAMVMGALPASLAGGIFAWALTYINPDSLLGIEVALMPVTMAMLGGTGFVAGPILGCAFISVVQELVWTKLPYLHLAIYGAMLILIGLYMPGGLIRIKVFQKVLAKFGLSERLYWYGLNAVPGSKEWYSSKEKGSEKDLAD
jgi:branched-chain amino acid transport system permease protein